MVIIRPGWRFTLQKDGDDIVVNGTTATWFGGGNDPGDNGETMSGVMNDGRDPHLMICALPVAWWVDTTADSPYIPRPHAVRKVPSIPWGTLVEVTCGNVTITTKLQDNGPTKGSQDGIDLSQAAFLALKSGTLADGVNRVSYRVRGGAKYLPFN